MPAFGRTRFGGEFALNILTGWQDWLEILDSEILLAAKKKYLTLINTDYTDFILASKMLKKTQEYFDPDVKPGQAGLRDWLDIQDFHIYCFKNTKIEKEIEEYLTTPICMGAGEAHEIHEGREEDIFFII